MEREKKGCPVVHWGNNNDRYTAKGGDPWRYFIKIIKPPLGGALHFFMGP